MPTSSGKMTAREMQDMLKHVRNKQLSKQSRLAAAAQILLDESADPETIKVVTEIGTALSWLIQLEV